MPSNHFDWEEIISKKTITQMNHKYTHIFAHMYMHRKVSLKLGSRNTHLRIQSAHKNVKSKSRTQFSVQFFI